MCGIFVAIDNDRYPNITPRLQELLSRRGPDSSVERHIRCPTGPDDASSTGQRQHGSWHILTYSTVLGLRGDSVTAQPLQDAGASPEPRDGSFLCWNGEAWTFAGASITGNDTQHVFTLLCATIGAAANSSCKHVETLISRTLAMYAGPYAFAFYHQSSQRLYFGRDPLGRRSLLVRKVNDGNLSISSVADVSLPGWEEVGADGVHWVDLRVKSPPLLEIQKTPYCFENAQALYAPPALQLQSTGVTDESLLLNSQAGSVDMLQYLLQRAVSSRVAGVRQNTTDPSASYAAVLFSGGLDCTVIARLAHEAIPEDRPIDLLNVAFENPRVHRKASVSGTSAFDLCPDRKTARTSAHELRTICPGRNWRLVCINIPYSEYLDHKQEIIDLIYPHNTEMDLSIACALYFASRGVGSLEIGQPYATPARVLLSGLGADELFAGYTRHATAFNRGGLTDLEAEMALDISRLAKRNLGRDDRVISHWSKEARYPFLDEELVRWSLKLPTLAKCGFGCTTSVDDSGRAIDPAKLVLRQLALKLGMKQVAHEKKRAIQFGARTAKMTEGKSKGTQLVSHSAS